MLTLSALQTQLVQAQPVHLQRYRPSKTHVQKSNIPRKARVSIPTAKHLQNNTHPSAQSNTFFELPTGTQTADIEWKCAGMDSQPILELPKELCHLFDDSELYTTKYQGNSGIWYAILFSLDPEFITRTMGNQCKCVKEVKQQMSIEMDDYYHKYKYRQYGYVKSDIDRMLTQQDDYHSTLGHYLTDFADINVLILLENKRFHWLGRFDENRITIVLYHKGMEWYAIVHPDQKSHMLDVSTVNTLVHKLAHVANLDASKQHANLVIDATVLTKLKKEIKNMKIKELQDRALQLELHIHTEHGKKKLKKDIQEEIYKQLTGCDTF
jgi:hypothetical protein